MEDKTYLVKLLRKSSNKVNERQIDFKAWAQNVKQLSNESQLRSTLKWWSLVASGKHTEKYMSGSLKGSGFHTPPAFDHEDILMQAQASRFASALQNVM